jgi:hypothetical protein
MSERRSATRIPVEMFFNKYLGGHPYLCRSLNLSSRGVLARTFVEPEQQLESFPLELRMPDSSDSVWVWARDAGRRGKCQVLEFLSIDYPGRERLEAFLRSADSH